MWFYKINTIYLHNFQKFISVQAVVAIAVKHLERPPQLIFKLLTQYEIERRHVLYEIHRVVLKTGRNHSALKHGQVKRKENVKSTKERFGVK